MTTPPGDAADTGTHTNHCCTDHGCKFGLDEHCPVVTRARPQTDLCQECTGIPAPGELRFTRGDELNITLKGSRVTDWDPATGDLTVASGADVNSITTTYNIAAITFECLTSAHWPPQAGDGWGDRHGRRYMAAYYVVDYDDRADSEGADSEGCRVVLLGANQENGDRPGATGNRPEYIMSTRGPMTLLWPSEDRRDKPAAEPNGTP